MAVWQKVFSRRNWENEPSTATPINETNLNVGDAALDEIDDRVIELNNRINTLQDYETRAAESAAEAAQSESNSEAWAVGQRDGTDVPSTDVTYHNNAKYYAGQAESAAQSAADDVASILQGYVDDAEGSADDASNNADLSQNWAVGTPTGLRDDEATNNSKYYSGQSHGWCDNVGDSGNNSYSATNNSYYYSRVASGSATQALAYKESCEDAVSEINTMLTLAEFDVDDNGNLIYTENSAFAFSVDNNGNLNWEVA